MVQPTDTKENEVPYTAKKGSLDWVQKLNFFFLSTLFSAPNAVAKPASSTSELANNRIYLTDKILPHGVLYV